MISVGCVLMITTGLGIIFGGWIGTEIGDDWLVLVFSLGGGIGGLALGCVLTVATWVFT